MRKIKNILILAGGDSTRFWPLKNKPIFSFLGKPILLYLIEKLSCYGENIVVVCHSSFKEKLTSLFKDNITIISQDFKFTGMAGAILSAKNYISGEVLIVNGSDIFNFEILNKFIDNIRKEKLEIETVSIKLNDYFPGGYLKIKDGKIIEIVEKPPPDKIPSQLIKLVIDYFSDFTSLTEAIEKAKTTKDDQYEQGLNFLLKTSKGNGYLLYDDFWYTLKYPWQVLSLMRFFLNKLPKDKIKLGKNVKIGKSVKIVGPTYIGDNSIIGDYVLIRESHVGANCVIGSFSEVARSYIANNVSLHRNYVGDSVIDSNVLVGAGAVFANFRFDGEPIKNSGLKKLGAIIGEGSRIGVNTTILPGVKIGRNTFIGPGETIMKDVEDNKFVFKGKIKSNISL